MTLSAEFSALVSTVDQLKADLKALPASSRLDEDDINAIYALAYNLLKQGRHDEALKYFSLLSLYRPVDSKILVGLAVTYQMLQMLDQAINVYSFAAVVEPENPEQMLSMAQCQIAQHAFAAAVDSLDIVIRFCTQNEGFDRIKQQAEALRTFATT